jgi:prepilin-type N-terminal cleavage/methylation domain-containing protein
MNKNAFTLIELLVVVAIIGILAAVGVVAYNGYTSAAKINAVKSNFKMAEKKLTEAITMCKSGLDFYWADGQNCQKRPINGDAMAWGAYGDFSKSVKINPYDQNTKAIEWSQLSDGTANCPPKKPPKGQIKLSYANNKNNFCNMGGGNTSCVTKIIFIISIA